GISGRVCAFRSLKGEPATLVAGCPRVGVLYPATNVAGSPRNDLWCRLPGLCYGQRTPDDEQRTTLCGTAASATPRSRTISRSAGRAAPPSTVPRTPPFAAS